VKADLGIDRFRTPLEDAVRRACTVSPVDGVADGLGQKLGAELVDQVLATGGKRLRGLLPPALVTLEGGDVDAAIEVGAAIEAIHNGTLVHDDIQDRDTLRRGQPTLWTVEGIPQAINAGDLLLIAPIVAVLQSEAIAADARADVATLVAGALTETIRGQVADVALRDAAGADLDTVSAIACAKTSPLFAAALRGAAIILGANKSRLDAATRAGRRIGLAFQIRDDLLDATGTKGRGLAGADFREGKPTWPVLAACNQAPASEVRELRDTLRAAANGHAPNEATVQRWLSWTARYDGIRVAKDTLNRGLDEAEKDARQAFDAGYVVIEALCGRLRMIDG